MKNISIKSLKILPVLCLVTLAACYTAVSKKDANDTTNSTPVVQKYEVLQPNPERTQSIMMVN